MWNYKNCKLQKCEHSNLWNYENYKNVNLQSCDITKQNKTTWNYNNNKNIKTLKFLTYVNTPALLPTLMWPYTDSPSLLPLTQKVLLFLNAACYLVYGPSHLLLHFFLLLKVNFLTVEEVKTKVLRTFFHLLCGILLILSMWTQANWICFKRLDSSIISDMNSRSTTNCLDWLCVWEDFAVWVY